MRLRRNLATLYAVLAGLCLAYGVSGGPGNGAAYVWSAVLALLAVMLWATRGYAS